jgi:SAM-dependent methyltransferase
MNSIAYYQNQALAYFEQTFEVDPASFLMPLVKHLPPGAKVLDVGCGSGRDMLWLQNRGFYSTGLDCSPDLSALAREKTGLSVLEADFETFDFSQMQMDALLLVGALVHLPQTRFLPVLKRILQALNSGGLLLITMKQGQGAKQAPDGRVFYLWQKEDLLPIFAELNLFLIESFDQTSKIRQSDTWMSFVLRKNND